MVPAAADRADHQPRLLLTVATALVAPDADHHNPVLIVLAPVLGGLVIGLMARFGSEKIRGHGMPEAIEAILTGGSKVQPRVAVLKPIASAIAIGTGGPFGAEGPIIMTGGAFGSLVAQFLHLTADERKTLLVAGAAGGMAATFNTPLASVLLAVELLLFEWRPRAFIPGRRRRGRRHRCRVPYCSAAAALFPVPHGRCTSLPPSYAAVRRRRRIAGLLAVVATVLVYVSEDAFGRLPVALDVVAGDRRSCHRCRRPVRATGARRRVRRHRRGAERAAIGWVSSSASWSSRR